MNVYMKCINCQEELTDLFCRSCLTQYHFQDKKKEDVDVLNKISAALIGRYKREKLGSYLNRLQERAIGNEDPQIVTNIKKLISNIENRIKEENNS